MKFVIKVKGGIVEYNGELFRETKDKEAARTVTEAKQIKKRFLKKYNECDIEVKECFNGKWKVIAL